MGSVRASISASGPSVVHPSLRAVSRVVALALLIVALPIIAVLAVAVRLSSSGPVLHREPAVGPRGRRIELLSFRVAVDGADSSYHQRLRAVVGANYEEALTGVGRVLRATGADRLPRLFNVAAGHTTLFKG